MRSPTPVTGSVMKNVSAFVASILLFCPSPRKLTKRYVEDLQKVGISSFTTLVNTEVIKI
jgi:hypothetical protein